MPIDRQRTIRRADRLIRLAGRGALAVVALALLFLLGNLAHYALAKGPAQRLRAEAVSVALPPLPPGTADWRLPRELEGDPWQEYQLVLLDFRAREVDFVALKLRGRTTSPASFEATIALLERAARRPPAPLPFAVERQIRGRDLADAAEVLTYAARRLIDDAASGAYDTTDTLRLRARAEHLLRARYATGHYLATRRFVLANVDHGLRLMRRSLADLHVFYVEEQRIAEAIAVEHLRIDLDARATHIELLMGYRDDDTDLEVWAKMLEQGDALAVRLQGAYRLAVVARRFWRLGESLRAVGVLERALADPANADIRGALYDALQAARSRADLGELFEGFRADAPGFLRNRLDDLF